MSAPLMSGRNRPMDPTTWACVCFLTSTQQECLVHGTSPEIDALLDVMSYEANYRGSVDTAVWLWETAHALNSALPLQYAREETA